MEITQASSAIGSGQTIRSSAGPGPKALGKQDFLQLLIAQLKNQDPLQPGNDREFIAQLAQFNTLEQMERMNQTLSAMATLSSLGQAAGLLGQQVEGLGPSGSVRGVVTGVLVDNGEPLVEVGGAKLPISGISRLLTPAAAAANP